MTSENDHHMPGPETCDLPPAVRDDSESAQYARCAASDCDVEYILVTTLDRTYWHNRRAWEFEHRGAIELYKSNSFRNYGWLTLPSKDL